MNYIALSEIVATRSKQWRTLRNYIKVRSANTLEALDDLVSRRFWLDERHVLHCDLKDGSDHRYCDPDYDWVAIYSD